MSRMGTVFVYAPSKPGLNRFTWFSEPGTNRQVPMSRMGEPREPVPDPNFFVYGFMIFFLPSTLHKS